MPSTELHHSYEVGAPPADVLAHLADPAHYIGLSPLLVDVREVRPGGDGTTRYVAVERFRFLGLFTHDNRIEVTLRADPSRLPAEATVSGDVVSPGGGTTSRLSDTLHLHAPFGLLRFAARQAAAVQQSRARALAARLAPVP
ncbi:SRPBCC family protein [Kitasatospora cineracea]|uniref:Polyketide cyclase/dehydrase/lipid transport protein n=1 Tax=Kitasatospora cineracea TaxID=88074 RepID=A0A3N4RZ82_9ACTN|nr:SRPBCC family protein [Kitasatospora cineracea]RPE33817.1 polyketide cyclase/dehydrase/lipid transport protein [Kitasatospora cineracea]